MVLTTLTLVVMLYAMTVTIANVALPQMQGALSATTDQIALVVTFNIIATAIATPMTGWLTARFSRRKIMIWGVVGFSLASLMCGFANSLETLVLFRVLQGAFGAPLVPLSQALVIDAYPPDKRGPAMAVFGMGVVLGPMLGPTIGGYLSEVYSWRWVFFMIVPVGVAALIGVMIYVTDRTKTKGAYLDWTGFLALSVAIASAQLMIDRGERLDWFDSPQIIVSACLAGLALYIFIAHTLTANRPFLNPRLLTDRNFALGLLFVFIFGMLNFTPMTLLPSLLQNLRGYPDSVIGLLLGARGAGTLIGFAFMFKGSNLDPRYTLLAGFVLQGIAGFYMAGFSLNLTMFDVMWTSALQGLGVGLIWVPLTTIAFNTMDPKDTAEASSIFHLIRNFGSSVYISISIAVVLRTSRMSYSEMTDNASPTNEAFQLQGPALLSWSLEGTGALAALSGEMGRQATMIGFINAFYMFAITSFLVCPFIFFVKLRRH